MGNCRSSPTADASSRPTAIPSSQQPAMKPPTAANNGTTTTPASSSSSPNNNNRTGDDEQQQSTSAFLQVLLPVVLPIVRQAISQQLISDRMVLHREELVEVLDKSSLPLGPIDISLEHIHVLDPDTLEKDMKAMPEFEWPEGVRFRSLMKSPTHTNRESSSNDEEGKLVVMDITGVTLSVRLAPGIELSVPVEGPLGLSATLELGTGGTISQAKLYLEFPKLRLWFVNEPRYKVYLAMLARPKILPQMHVNVDRGQGDFLHMEFNGGGGLDDTIESMLCGFGPSSLTHKSEETISTSGYSATAKVPEKRNWVADALGRRISEALEVFAGVGKDRPLEFDLHEPIQASIDAALGKTRSVEDIQAEIDALKAELELVKEAAEPKHNTKGILASVNQDEKKKGDTESYFILEEEDATKATADVAPNFFFCGTGV